MTEQHSTENSTNGGDGAKVQIREFLYLDFPKLTSYFAQVREGLPTTIQESLGFTDRNLAREPQHETAVEGAGKVQTGAPDMEPSVARLLGLMAQLDAKVSRLIRTGGDEGELSETRYQIETKELHHEIFALVEKMLYQRGLVSLQGDSTGPFHAVKGQADFLDFDFLAKSIKNFPNLGKTYSTMTKQPDFSKDVRNTKQLSEMIEQFYSKRMGMVISTPELTATAYLQPDHLTAPMQFITDSYGRQTQVDITLFGLKIGEQYPEEETSGQVPFLASQENQAMSGLSGMAQSILQASRGMEGMDRFFRIRGDIHLYPVAVYVDLTTSV